MYCTACEGELSPEALPATDTEDDSWIEGEQREGLNVSTYLFLLLVLLLVLPAQRYIVRLVFVHRLQQQTAPLSGVPPPVVLPM